jgi:hypothetical protein
VSGRIRIEPAALTCYDLQTGELLRTRSNPLQPERLTGLRGVRTTGAAVTAGH